MKTLKILFAAVVLAGFTTSAMGQDQQAEATAEASALILSALSVEKDNDIDFGQVVPNTAPNLRSNAAIGESTEVGATAELGKFTISGAPGADVQITFTTAVNMTNGTDNLQFNPSVYRTSNDNADFGSTEVENDSDYIIDEGGYDYFFIGGSLNEDGSTEDVIPSTISGGEYTSDFTLTAEYN